MDDFFNIEPTFQNENLSPPINIENIENGRNLDASFEKAKNPGEKVELFFVLAENKPEVAVSAFAEILHNKTNLVKLALALQGLGRIGDPHIKRALAACENEEDLQILRDVANRVKGKGEASSDLTRWAAAWVIENIGFPRDAIEHLQGGALTDPPYRIRNEIINRKLQEIGRLQQRDSRNEFTPEYERNLEFWLYGPTEELFRQNSNSVQYQTLVGDVIYCLNVRGIELAIDKDKCFLQIDYDEKRRWLQQQALGIARTKFGNFTEFEQKRAYETIEHFLSNDFNEDIPLRNLAAHAIKQAGSWLSTSIRARSFVICEEWQQVAAIGEPALTHLQQVIERQLRLTKSENEFREHKIKALETILAIFDKNYAEISASNHKIVDHLLLTEFLSNNYNNNILWRKSAAQAIKQAGSWLPVSIRARSFVICEEWPQVAAIGEPAVSHLEEVIERNLRLAASEDEIINQQIKAVEAINQIQFAEFSEKIKKLVKVLLCPKEQVRKAAARLLKPYKEVDPNIANLVDALLFEYSLDKPELKDLTVPRMDERLSSCGETESFIATTFANAIAEANSLTRIYSKSASTVQKVLQSKQEAYLSDIRGWITQIKKQIGATSRYQNQIKYYQESLKDALYEIRGIDSKLYEELMAVPKQAALNRSKFQTYNQCQNLSPDLEYIKSQFVLEIDKYQAKLNQESENRFEGGLCGIVIGVGIIVIYVIFTSLHHY